MNPNISALFTFPNKRFPGNPGSRPEPAWSLVPDAIMVNSPFGRHSRKVFLLQMIKESCFGKHSRYFFQSNIQDIFSILFKYLHVHMEICICKDSSNLFLKIFKKSLLCKNLHVMASPVALAKNHVHMDRQDCREGDGDL